MCALAWQAYHTLRSQENPHKRPVTPWCQFLHLPMNSTISLSARRASVPLRTLGLSSASRAEVLGAQWASVPPCPQPPPPPKPHSLAEPLPVTVSFQPPKPVSPEVHCRAPVGCPGADRCREAPLRHERQHRHAGAQPGETGAGLQPGHQVMQGPGDG